MKTIFFGEAASDSGSLGFSEAWPLGRCQQKSPELNEGQNVPSCPHGVDVHTLRNIDNELDIGVVVVVGTSGHLNAALATASAHRTSSKRTHLNILVRHADVLSVRLEILGRGHDGELDRPLVAKRLVCPFPHRADLFDRCNTVVRDEHLQSTVTSALAPHASPKPLNKGGTGFLTLVMTVWPSWAATKSFTLPGAAVLRWLPPMKCGARLCFAAHELGAPLAVPLAPFLEAPAILSVGSPMHGVWWRREGGRAAVNFLTRALWAAYPAVRVCQNDDG